MAVYQLAFLGGVPLGSLAGGLVSAAVGPERLLLGASACMLAVVTGVGLGTGMARME